MLNYEVTLLIFGILLLLIGLVGKVKAKELEVGTSSKFARAATGVVGVALIILSLPTDRLPFMSQNDQPGWTQYLEEDMAQL